VGISVVEEQNNPNQENMMTFCVHFDDEHDCFIGSFIGRLDSSTVGPYTEQLRSEASKHECRRFLNDMRRAEIDFTTFELYGLPGILGAAGFDRSWRRAIVAHEQFEDYYFYETVAVNRGYQVKVFADFDEAMTWLKSAG
jgi:hypothetical protein